MEFVQDHGGSFRTTVLWASGKSIIALRHASTASRIASTSRSSVSSVAPLVGIVVLHCHVLFDAVEPNGDFIKGLQQQMADLARQVRLCR
jgi:hypothetical protein